MRGHAACEDREPRNQPGVKVAAVLHSLTDSVGKVLSGTVVHAKFPLQRLSSDIRGYDVNRIILSGGGLTRLFPPPIVPSRASTFRGHLAQAAVAGPPPISTAKRSFVLFIAPHCIKTTVEHGLRSMAKGSFGEPLKRQREMREISLNELTVATRVPLKFLEAFENEDWDKLPGGVFNRGFVRAIARFLGLSEEHLLAEYDLAYGEYRVATPPPPENPIPSPPKWLVALGALVILLAIAATVAGVAYGLRRYAAYRATKKALASSVQPQPQVPAALPNLVFGATPAPVSTASAALDLSLSTSAATRIRVVGDGKVLMDRQVAARETRHFSAGQQFEVTAADSAGVLLELNGQAMPPLGAPGTSGTIVLSHKDLRQASSGNSEP
jgi:cytoskeleton protein RodZ